MKFTILKQRIVPQTRTLKANWTIDWSDFNMATTPWQYVDNWSKSDRGPDETLIKLNKRMQERWPGRYQIVEKEVRDPDRMYRRIVHKFEFNTPRDETWFRMQHP